MKVSDAQAKQLAILFSGGVRKFCTQSLDGKPYNTPTLVKIIKEGWGELVGDDIDCPNPKFKERSIQLTVDGEEALLKYLLDRRYARKLK